MKHAFIITAYKAPNQLLDLIDQLDCEDSHFYIHIDRRSKSLFEPFISRTSSRGNVSFASRLRTVHWGGFSHLRALICLLELAFEKQELEYFHTLSGQCFPTTSLRAFDEFFTANRGKEYIATVELPTSDWAGGGLNRLEYYHLNDLFDPKQKWYRRYHDRWLRLQARVGLKRKLPVEFEKVYGGTGWWSLSKEAVGHVLGRIRNEPHLLYRFRHTAIPEEIFFQTMLMNSSFADRIVSEDLRYIDWSQRNGSFPANLDETDFEKIVNSPKLFARKIEAPYGQNLQSMLKGHIGRAGG